jgi:hypothetical protein
MTRFLSEPAFGKTRVWRGAVSDAATPQRRGFGTQVAEGLLVMQTPHDPAHHSPVAAARVRDHSGGLGGVMSHETDPCEAIAG